VNFLFRYLLSKDLHSRSLSSSLLFSLVFRSQLCHSLRLSKDLQQKLSSFLKFSPSQALSRMTRGRLIWLVCALYLGSYADWSEFG